MPILNYTTKIDTAKTIAEIQAKLVVAGAEAVLTEYKDGIVNAVSFRMQHKGALISFRLPARIMPILLILRDDPNVPRKLKTCEQAARVSWRIVKVWIEAQLALVEAEQAEMVQVFLPYAQDATGKTVYERLADSGFKMLGHDG